MRIRIVTFDLGMPREDYDRLATKIAPALLSWPGLIAKWWLGDTASGTYGRGVPLRIPSRRRPVTGHRPVPEHVHEPGAAARHRPGIRPARRSDRHHGLDCAIARSRIDVAGMTPVT